MISSQQTGLEAWRIYNGTLNSQRLSGERLERMVELTSVTGPANCWTGTSGELSAMIRELMAEREQLLREIEQLTRNNHRGG